MILYAESEGIMTLLLLICQSRRIVVNVTIVTSHAGINRVPLAGLSSRDNHGPVGMVIQIALYGFGITAAAGTYKGADSHFRTVGRL